MTILREAPRYFREIANAGPLLGRALDIALAFDHPVYDCLYVALAERRGERLLTADRRLLKRFEATPLASRLVAFSDWRPDLERPCSLSPTTTAPSATWPASSRRRSWLLARSNGTRPSTSPWT